MTPQVTNKVASPVEEQRNERLAKTLIKNLHRRHIEAFYCSTKEEAVKKVSELIPNGSSITWGGSMTIRDLRQGWTGGQDRN